MNKFIALILVLFVSACASDQPKNPKDIPVDTGARPQNDVIVAAPPGTLGHGKF